MAITDITPRVAILRSLDGIMTATKADSSIAHETEQLLVEAELLHPPEALSSLQNALKALSSTSHGKNAPATCAAKLAFMIAYMRKKSQTRATDSIIALTEADCALIEEVVYDALSSPLFKTNCTGRSHQGFLSVPLCRLDTPDGYNNELWRLHVWLPNSPKPDPKFAVHSHQSFGQSWILAGEAENTLSHARPTEEPTIATHAIYKLAQQYNKTMDSGTIDQKEGAVVENTGKLLVATESLRERCRRNQSYVVPSDLFHSTEIQHGTVLATMFFFDASRGFVRDAGVELGPVNGTQFRQYRNPEGIPPHALVKAVRAVRCWEILIEKALLLAQNGEWSNAMDVFEEAARSWNPYLNPGTVEQNDTPHDYQGIDCYQEVARNLTLWSKYMAKGEEHLQTGNENDALSMFQASQDLCCSTTAFPAVKMCIKMACEKAEKAVRDLRKRGEIVTIEWRPVA